VTDRERIDAFRGALRIPTVSRQTGGTDLEPFLLLHAHLAARYPHAFRTIGHEVVAGGSLLLSWDGTSPGAAPVLMTAHLDVVPAGDPSAWHHPPFSGEFDRGRIWGRGALDYKVGVCGMLQACEDLLDGGFRPARGLCLAFGHDEEVGGIEGAAAMTGLLEQRGLRFSCVLDEGGYLYSPPWLDGEIAVIGLAEKGYVTLRLTATGVQGHASTPRAVTPAGRLGLCLHRIEERQMPVRICAPVHGLLAGTPRMGDTARSLAEADPGEAGRMLAAWPSGNALVRSTVATTILSGGCKENVLPAEVHAIVNCRPLPGDTVGDVISHVEGIAAPLGIEVTVEDPRRVFEPSRESTLDTRAGEALIDSVRAVWPGMAAVPGIFPAATDSRHYSAVADQVYRFVPVPLGREGPGALHAEGESLAAADYLRAVLFYREFIVRVAGGGEVGA